MIVTQDLSKRFEDFVAVDGITLTVGAGEVLALLGPNGAGKTTTIRMLTSVLLPWRGWAKVAGYDVVKQASKVRASVGILTEHPGLYARMPAGEYLDFFGQLYGLQPTARKKNVGRLLEEFGLQSHRDQRIGEFSKGMRQKLALARALLHDPPVLLMDEPTSAMDPESARLVRDSIQSLRSKERTIVICTHNLSEAEELADRIAIIRRGRIIALGSPSDLKQKFLGPPEFEVRLGTTLNGRQPQLPQGITLTTQGSNWLRYQSPQPEHLNPQVLQTLLAQDYPVISLQEVVKSLERVYLQAINLPDEVESETETMDVR